MKRFFASIGRFFWSWGFLEFVLGLIALGIVLYVEEDWRGAHDWAMIKAKWEAQGESFDYAKFIPPPVPDDENLAAIPLFKLEPVKNEDGSSTIEPVTLQKAMRSDLSNRELPRTGNFQRGDLPDMGKIRSGITGIYTTVFKGAVPPTNILTQFNTIYPFLNDFIAESARRPLYRIKEDYLVSPPSARPLGPVTDQITLSKLLALHAVIAIEERQPDLALSDLETNYKISCGVARDPSLVGGLVAIGVAAIGNGALYNGVAEHAWSDAQLAKLDQALSRADFLSGFQFAMRCEVARSAGNFDFYQNLASRRAKEELFDFSKAESLETLISHWPSGWWEENKCGMAERLLTTLATVDPKERRVLPKTSDRIRDEIESAKAGWYGYAPWNLLATISTGPITSAVSHFAQAQVCIDEARIACALERYRLVHGVYPETLEALAPGYIDEVPHDIMNGEPYRYKLRADGTFLLYSVGWNQTDDGGKVVYKKDGSTVPQVEYTEGDWVWPTPKGEAKK